MQLVVEPQRHLPVVWPEQQPVVVCYIRQQPQRHLPVVWPRHLVQLLILLVVHHTQLVVRPAFWLMRQPDRQPVVVLFVWPVRQFVQRPQHLLFVWLQQLLFVHHCRLWQPLQHQPVVLLLHLWLLFVVLGKHLVWPVVLHLQLLCLVLLLIVRPEKLLKNF